MRDKDKIICLQEAVKILEADRNDFLSKTNFYPWEIAKIYEKMNYTWIQNTLEGLYQCECKEYLDFKAPKLFMEILEKYAYAKAKQQNDIILNKLLN